jgi:hypothetical protein
LRLQKVFVPGAAYQLQPVANIGKNRAPAGVIKSGRRER